MEYGPRPSPRAMADDQPSIEQGPMGENLTLK